MGQLRSGRTQGERDGRAADGAEAGHEPPRRSRLAGLVEGLEGIDHVDRVALGLGVVAVEDEGDPLAVRDGRDQLGQDSLGGLHLGLTVRRPFLHAPRTVEDDGEVGALRSDRRGPAGVDQARDAPSASSLACCWTLIVNRVGEASNRLTSSSSPAPFFRADQVIEGHEGHLGRSAAATYGVDDARRSPGLAESLEHRLVGLEAHAILSTILATIASSPILSSTSLVRSASERPSPSEADAGRAANTTPANRKALRDANIGRSPSSRKSSPPGPSHVRVAFVLAQRERTRNPARNSREFRRAEAGRGLPISPNPLRGCRKRTKQRIGRGRSGRVTGRSTAANRHEGCTVSVHPS